MKSIIELWHREELARRLHMSRSRLYAEALRSYLEKNDRQALTERLNKIYGEEASELDPSLKTLQNRTF